MSTGLNCELYERKPGEWFYILEHGSAPKQSWDWREFATAFGPFSTEDEAHDHLHRHHANPGGYSVVMASEPGFQEDAVRKRLCDEAPEATKGYGEWSTY